MRDLRVQIADAIKDSARAVGAHAVITTAGKGRQCAEISYCGQSRRVFLTNGPSKSRSFKAIARDLQEALRSMGATR